MAAVGSQWVPPRAQWQRYSYVKWRSALLCIGMTSIPIIFSMSLALFPLVVRGLLPPARFDSVQKATRDCNSLCGRISPACMYVVLNVVIIIIGIMSGILRSSSIDESCSGCIKVHFDASPSLKVVYGNSRKEDLKLQPLVSEVDRIQKFNPPHSLISRESISKPPRQENLLLRRFPTINADLATSGISVECRIVESAPLKPRKANEILCEECPSSPRLFFIEVSDEKAEAGSDGDQLAENEDLSADELYVKAETFIGNFYRQLRMQREDSWKRICGIHRESC